MGYYILSYGFNTSEFKSTFGSNDSNIINTIAQTESFKRYKDFIDNQYDFTLQKALNTLIDGETCGEKFDFAYRYAFVCLCEGLGDKLPYANEIKYGYETDLINNYLKTEFAFDNFEIEKKLLDIKHFSIKILSLDKFPMMGAGLILTAELIELKNKFDKIDISDTEIEKVFEENNDELGHTLKHIMGIKNNVEFCLNNKLDLISFCR